MTPNEHPHCETQILPAKDYNETLSKQFITGCHQQERSYSQTSGRNHFTKNTYF